MNGSAGASAALSLWVESKKSGYTLRATAGPDEREIARAVLPESALNARASLPAALLEVKNLAVRLDGEPDWPDAGPALDKLRDKGTDLAFEIFGRHDAFYDFAEACAHVLTPELRQRSDPPLVELNSDTRDLLPIELLPFFVVTDWPESIENATDVACAAQSFLGFSAVLRRVPPADVQQDTVLASRPLPVAFVRNVRLSGAAQEATALRDFGEDVVALEEPIPAGTGLSEREVVKLLSRRIYNAVSGAATGASMDQVLHFACHCDADALATANWLLRIGDEVRVTMGDLIAELGYREVERRRTSPRPTRPSRPLVFMNACDTSSINPASAASFVDVFLGNGNRGFIGTETRIPDRVAAFVSHVFYERVLAGHTVGRALH
ncbi:MAG: CHAT domain-containing protein, partial [Actinomycetota bacterium]|nr:CHAT domain-containing protein [Actinomycetota bacterium]